jgi:hypothetical protein
VVGWLVGGELLLKDFGPYGILIYACVIIAVAMAMVLKDYRPYGIKFITVCLLFQISRHF